MADGPANTPEAPTIAVAPSASVPALLRARVEQARPDRPLPAIGGVPYDRMAGGPATTTSNRPAGAITGFFDAALPAKLPTLPRAEAEVRTAASILGPRSVVLVGDGATESALKAQDLSRYEVVHVAAHGFADPKFPERAAIVLVSDPVAGEDGLLQPREIARYRLRARLVVLSACETAVGPTIGQEGVLNVARAFLIAGAGSVMTTLWPVSDATAAALMRQFYEHLAGGDDVSEALRLSKRAVVERFGPDALSTVAAFQIVGDGGQRLGSATRGPVVFLGGRDLDTQDRLRTSLRQRGFHVRSHSNPRLYGAAIGNICNRCRTGAGVQVELSSGLRRSCFRPFSSNGRKVTTQRFADLVAALRNGLNEQYPALAVDGGRRSRTPKQRNAGHQDVVKLAPRATARSGKTAPVE